MKNCFKIKNFFQLQYFVIFVANMYFPRTQYPELFQAFRIMVTTLSIRQLQKNLALFSADLEYIVRERPDEDVDAWFFSPLFGKIWKFYLYFKDK